MYYIKEINNHKIGDFTESEKVAKTLGWTIIKKKEEIEQSLGGDWYETGYIPKDKELDTKRTNKLSEIKSAFEWQESNGTIFVDNDTFEIDARRTDKDNMDDLIKYSNFPINYVGKTAIRPNTTKEELESFRKAVFDYGIANYEKKWYLETQVANATTKEEIELIKW